MLPKYPYGNHIGEQFGHLLAVDAIETDPNTGDPVIYDCKCMKCGKEHIHVLDKDLLLYNVLCCENCDKNDLTGMKFGKLTVLEKIGRDKHFNFLWKCQCSCKDHNIVVTTKNRLKWWNTCSCGCFKLESARKRTRDLTGQTFGRLKVLRRAPNSKPTPGNPSGRVHYVCQCSCPEHTIVTVDAYMLVSGNTRSCGCYNRERSHEVHKRWTDEELVIVGHYNDMMKRCYNPNCQKYHCYGGRGITVCDEWKDPVNGRRNFVEWAKANGFSNGLTLDRKNPGIYHKNHDGPYAPWNCRWVDWITQANNKRTNTIVEIDGISHTVAEWSRISGIKYGHLKYLLNKGHDFFRDAVQKAKSLRCSR